MKYDQVLWWSQSHIFRKWLFCNLHGSCKKLQNISVPVSRHVPNCRFCLRIHGIGPEKNQHRQVASKLRWKWPECQQKHQHALHVVSKCSLSHSFAKSGFWLLPKRECKRLRSAPSGTALAISIWWLSQHSMGWINGKVHVGGIDHHVSQEP